MTDRMWRHALIACARGLTVLVARRHRPLSPCLVLAPHADDETLGCGGTIAAMRAAGVAVTVVIATDGAGSDHLGRDPDVVVASRRAEAVHAARVLGVAASDVVFLDLPDGQLDQRIDELTAHIEAVVREVEPAQVLVPSVLDRHTDHVALHRACAGADLLSAEALEYLVWAWPQWPLTAIARAGADGAQSRPGLRATLSLLRRLRRSGIKAHRVTKRNAIAEYPSQIGTGDAARGLPTAMLRAFDRPVELFVASSATTRARSPAVRLRRWLRTRHPRIRSLLLRPRRLLHNRRWKRRHLEVSAEDRQVLEDVILPSIREEVDGSDVLFVGVAWYTQRYPALFPDGNLVTVDYEPALAKHGATRHFTLDVRQLSKTFADESFGAIVANGVFGHGVDEPGDIDVTLQAFRRCLRPDGLLVVGWNDVDAFALAGLTEAVCRAGFEPTPGAGLASPLVGPLGPMRHIYEVFRAVVAIEAGSA